MPYSHRLPALFVCLFLAFVPRAQGQPPAIDAGPPARVDRYGDPLPAGAVARLGTVRLRGRYPLFSPDGKRLATASPFQLRLWDVDTGKQVREFVCPRYDVKPLGFSADGKRFYSVELNDCVRAWDTVSGHEVLHFKLDPGNGDARLSPDAKLVASFGSRDIHLYEAESGKPLRVLEGSRAELNRVDAFSPDGKLVAGQRSGLFEPRNADGAPQKVVYLWDVATGQRLHKLGGVEHSNMAVAVAFSWDNRLVATGSFKGVVHIWDTATGQEVRRFIHQPNPTQLAFTRDNKLLLTTATDETFRVWDVATGRVVRSLKNIPRFVLSPDGKLVASPSHEAIRLWDFATGKDIHSFEGHHDGLAKVVFLKDGKTVTSVDRRGGLRTWDVATSRSPRSHQTAWLYGISPDGRILACSAGSGTGRLSLRETASGTELRQIPLAGHGRNPSVYGLAFSADGAKLAVSFGDWHHPLQKGARTCSLAIWNATSGLELWRRSELSTAGVVTWSPDGTLLALRARLSGRSVIELWDAARGQPLYLLTAAGDDESQALAFSPDGRLLVSPSSRSVKPDREYYLHLWEVASGKERALVTGPNHHLYFVGFSPDGRTIATAGTEEVIRLWDAATCQERASLRGHTDQVSCLAFSPDGRLLVSGSHDTTLLVWNVAKLLGPKPPPAVRPSPKELGAAWNTLAGADAMAAHQAIHALTSAPDLALPLLRKRLSPALPARPELPRWVKELDDARFAVRDKAGRELEKAGESAVPLLEKALAGQPSAELRRRAEGLLKVLRGPVTQPDVLRAVRAIEVLEAIGTADARQLLQTLAGGAPARQTREATTALQRLQKRATVLP